MTDIDNRAFPTIKSFEGESCSSNLIETTCFIFIGETKMQKWVGSLSRPTYKCRPGIFYAEEEGLMNSTCLAAPPCKFPLLVNPYFRSRYANGVLEPSPLCQADIYIVYRGLRILCTIWSAGEDVGCLCIYMSVELREVQLLYYIRQSCMFAVCTASSLLFCKLFGSFCILNRLKLMLRTYFDHRRIVETKWLWIYFHQFL